MTAIDADVIEVRDRDGHIWRKARTLWHDLDHGQEGRGRNTIYAIDQVYGPLDVWKRKP